MFSKVSNKRKLFLLAIGSVILLFVMFRLAFSKTLELRRNCVVIEQNLGSSNQLPLLIESLQAEISDLERIIGSNSNDENFIRQQLLENVGEYCQLHSIQLMEIPYINSRYNNGYNFQNNLVRLQGDYKTMLGLVYKLENEWKIARVMSVKFYLKRDIRQRKDFLFADIYLQNIKS